MNSNEQTLGVLGGLGPLATAYYLELVVTMTDAATDQEHPKIIIMNTPGIPDRTAYILGKSQASPLPPMVALGKQLKSLGVGIIATPCITAHYFHAQLQEQIGLPLIHGIECVAKTLRDSGVKTVGLMATDGTVQSGIFQQQVEALGMQLVVPGEAGQKAVMELIYDQVKAGKQPDLTLFQQVSRELQDLGAEAVVLGCTELSLLKKQYPLGNGIIDALEVLAKESVLACGKQVKEEYHTLFTPFSGKE
jgi:aspartate racemase